MDKDEREAVADVFWRKQFRGLKEQYDRMEQEKAALVKEMDLLKAEVFQLQTLEELARQRRVMEPRHSREDHDWCVECEVFDNLARIRAQRLALRKGAES